MWDGRFFVYSVRFPEERFFCLLIIISFFAIGLPLFVWPCILCLLRGHPHLDRVSTSRHILDPSLARRYRTLRFLRPTFPPHHKHGFSSEGTFPSRADFRFLEIQVTWIAISSLPRYTSLSLGNRSSFPTVWYFSQQFVCRSLGGDCGGLLISACLVSRRRGFPSCEIKLPSGAVFCFFDFFRCGSDFYKDTKMLLAFFPAR